MPHSIGERHLTLLPMINIYLLYFLCGRNAKMTKNVLLITTITNIIFNKPNWYNKELSNICEKIVRGKLVDLPRTIFPQA